MSSSPAVRVVDFNKLPGPIKERFVACTKGGAPPHAIVQQQLTRGGATAGWITLAVLAAAGVAGLWLLGFGEAWHPVQSPAYLVAYVGCVVLVTYSVLAIVRRFKVVGALPYTPGRYLFPLDFVDARSHALRIVPLSTLSDFRGVHQHYNGVYSFTVLTFVFEGGIKEAFQVRGKELAESIMAELRGSQAAVRQAVEARDLARLQVLDPFMTARLEDKWEVEPVPFGGMLPGGAAGAQLTARPLPGWLTWASLPALVLGGAVGAPLFLARNAASDAAAFARVRHGETYELEAYLEHGGKHAEEVRTKLLPRRAFEDAKKKASVTALREVLKKYPGAEVEPEIKTEVHALFVKTSQDFLAQAASDNAALRPFMDQLFGYLEGHDDPRMQVRFRKPSTEALKSVDAEAVKTYGANLMPIGAHFTDAKMQGRESSIVSSLGQAFGKIFPADVLSLDMGARATHKLAPADIAQPTIEIGYEVSPSGAVYEEQTGTRKFVGIQVAFAVAMRLPQTGETLEFELAVEPPEEFTVSTSGYGVAADPGAV
ncbi:MAG: hypothetical protein IT373_13170, partial [Polyangiaceae bacterium]|nr:hypothetical protein [Polyangiaceae bacterium]